MSLYSNIKKQLERRANIRLFRYPPRGVCFFSDLKNYLGNYSADVVFDVGANIGQSLDEYLRHFHAAAVYCFEPQKACCDVILRNHSKNKKIKIINMALGDNIRDVHVEHAIKSDMSKIIEGKKAVQASTSPVKMTTVDRYCIKAGVSKISLLKIDTEGSDLDVLEGAASMLDSMSIDVVQCEAGINRTNNDHVPIEAIKLFLENKKYFIFGIYEQVNEWVTGHPYLRRVNVVFISSQIAERNRI